MEEKFITQMSEIISNLDESQSKVEKHTYDVINSSDTSLNLVKDGINGIGEIVEQINELNRMVEQSTENIKELKKLSKLIEDFAIVITKIAGKTNMLSLNASIEAARAGEQGRGFAVVAKQVGELAAQSTKSSKDISDTVREVQGFVETMVTSMNDIHDMSVKQNAKAASIGEILNKMLEAAETTSAESKNVENEIVYQKDITDSAKAVLNKYSDL
ncbi:MAG: methyl-accepting chemotaxis protein [Butyrivibrio sp.]